MKNVKRLLMWYGRQWKWLLLLVILVPLLSAVNVRTQVALGNVVDSVRVWERLLKAAGWYSAMILLQVALSQAQKAIQSALNVRMTRDLRERIARKILMSPSALMQAYSEGELLQMWNQDVKDVQKFSVEAAVTFAVSCISAVLALVELGRIALLLPLLSLALNALTLIPMNMLGRRNKAASSALRDAQTAMNETFYGILDCIRVVKAFGKEEQEAERFARSNDVYIDRKMDAFVTNRMFKSIVTAINSVAPIAVILLASRESLGDGFTVGSVVTAIALFSTVSQPFNAAGNLFIGFKSVGYKIEALHQLFSLEEEKAGGADAISAMDMELRNVGVSTGGKTILSDIDLHIKSGEKVAIVGDSGSGKSTLCKVLAQILAPTQGNLLLNRMNLTDYSLDEYRKRIYYSQSSVYFPYRTLMDNLRMYGATEEEIYKLARDMGIDGDIREIGEGYFTEIEANSANLSGGQIKKIEALRALSTPRMLYLFDEITSGMDPASSDKVMDYLVRRVKGTVVFVLHDLQYAKWMDQVVIMEGGRILDSGSHESLLGRCERYREFVDKANVINRKER